MDRGVALFDTAQVYGPFANEELVGEALAPGVAGERHWGISSPTRSTAPSRARRVDERLK